MREQAALRPGRQGQVDIGVVHRIAGGAVAEAELTHWMTLNSPFAAGPFAVREAVLFESFPGRDGPHYEPRLAVPLQRLLD